MSQDKYSNFVRPSSSSNESRLFKVHPTLSGHEARKLYLEEIKEIGDPEPTYDDTHHNTATIRRNKTSKYTDSADPQQLTTRDLFLSAQNNDVDTLRWMLDNSPDKINTVDDYGWSLLMIACQANSVAAAKELLNRDIDMSTRDKAGNSARSLVIKNKNLVLADLLLSQKRKSTEKTEQEIKHKKVKLKQAFTCDICHKTFPDKEDHLSSTIHNFNASKGKKIPAHYVIPISNKGYQLMLKDGWDRQSGLGPDGSGNRYPIKTVQKKDRKGLGHKQKESVQKDTEPYTKNRKVMERNHRKSRTLEVNFRREFY